jgi:hypothetical protein
MRTGRWKSDNEPGGLQDNRLEKAPLKSQQEQDAPTVVLAMEEASLLEETSLPRV